MTYSLSFYFEQHLGYVYFYTVQWRVMTDALGSVKKIILHVKFMYFLKGSNDRVKREIWDYSLSSIDTKRFMTKYLIPFYFFQS